MKYAECWKCGSRINIGDKRVAFAFHKFCNRGCIQSYVDSMIKDFIVRECDCDFEDDAE